MKEILSPGMPVSCRLQMPGEPGIVVQEKDPVGDLTVARSFSFKMSVSCTN
jgi:hypothetical protein